MRMLQVTIAYYVTSASKRMVALGNTNSNVTSWNWMHFGKPMMTRTKYSSAIHVKIDMSRKVL